MKRPIRGPLFVLTLLPALFVGMASLGARADGDAVLPFVPGAVLVRFRPNVPPADRWDVVRRFRLNVDERVASTEFARLVLAAPDPSGSAVKNILSILNQDPRVEAAQPDFVYQLDAVPNDALFGDQWGMLNTGQNSVTTGADIKAPDAWDVTTGSLGIIVAVIDTGIQYDHPDLRFNLYTNAGEMGGNPARESDGIDNDMNGRIDDWRGWDFFNNDNDATDDNGHGTHVSGTIGAQGNNFVGVAGVMHRVRILPLKAFNNLGQGTSAAIVMSIDYAIGRGARVINASFGSGAPDAMVQAAVQRAETAGILVAAAAGNAGSNNDATPFYPSNLNQTLTNVISVAASDWNDALGTFSNFGTTVDLAAPGVRIISTWTSSSYAFLNGTSMAAPHVAGAIALTMSAFPALTYVQVKRRVLGSVDEPSTIAGRVKYGRLNLKTMLEVDVTPPGTPTELAITGRTSTSLAVTWKSSGDDGTTGHAHLYELRYSTAAINAGNFAAATPVPGLPVPLPTGQVQGIVINGLTTGTPYFVALRAVDNCSNVSGIATAGPVTPAGAVTNMTLLNDDVEGAPQFLGVTPWAVTTEDSFSPTHSYTDSPGTTYVDNLNIALTQTAAVNLTSAVAANLSFRARTDLEFLFDFLLVDVSTNGGGSWTQLGTSVTGTTAWTLYNVSLSSFVGQMVQVRFRLLTDFSIVRDGVWIDDIRISADFPDPVAYLPKSPGNFAATAFSDRQIDLSWRDDADNEAAFQIERRTGVAAFAPLATLPPNTTAFSDTNGLLPGTTYDYQIRTGNPVGFSPYTGPASATTSGLAAPSGLTANALDGTRVQLQWTDNSPDEIGFKLERRTGAGPFLEIRVLAPNATEFIDQPVAPGVTYTYRLRAVSAAGFSEYSNTAIVTPPSVPTAPTGLTVAAIDPTQVRLDWTDTSGIESGFRIERKKGSGSYGEIAIVGANVVTFTDTGLLAGTAYTYRVRAFNAAGNSAYSNEAAAPLVAPAAPTNLLAAAVSNTRIDLTWTDNSTGETGFKIERRIGAGAFTQIRQVAANTTSAIDQPLTPNTFYEYRVRAFAGVLNSAYSNTSSATTPNTLNPPTGLAAAALSNSAVRLTWTDNATNETGFRIERRDGTGPFREVGVVGANVIEFTNTGLRKSTSYSWRVRAYNATALSAYSNVVALVTPARAHGRR